MAERNSFERRYSFNIAQGNPVAESTHFNESGFSWGQLSPKYRSYSSSCLNNSQNSSTHKKSIVSSRPKNITQIDARIAADVQSKGLASRIVKYHESGSMLNRSMSAHNLYSKPGQFPAVTLKKTNLPYRATKKELSMIRIPPPEKSSFYGNTISSLLRSSSVVGLQSKRNEDLSTENRPIIHPPPTENDMAPTRSVLDVLKEISRKRINSDDLESEEASKKYCNHNGNDIADTVHGSSALSPNCIASSLSCQRYKRQRDCITPHQVVQLSEKMASPEQAKKRVCNYNNDITSSLSSTLKCKRIISPYKVNQTTSANIELCDGQKSKLVCHHPYKNNKKIDMRFENLESTSANTEISHANNDSLSACTQEQNNINGIVPNRTVSETFYNPNEKITNSVQPEKPRLTLFNKKCDDTEIQKINQSPEWLTGTNSDTNEDDCAGISFVKPKKITSKRLLRNPVIERTQKSKLALMLSGLRGELYQNVDETDSTKEKKNNEEICTKNTIPNTDTVTAALKPITTPATTFNSLEAPKPANQLDFPTTVKSIPLSTNSQVPVNKTSSPLVGIKLSPPNTSSEIVTNISSADAKKITETQSKPDTPVLGGFSFGINNANSSSPVISSSFSNTLADSKITTVATSSVSKCSNSIVNFGQSTQLTPVTSDDEKHKLPAAVQPAAKNNLLQLPSIGMPSVLTPTTESSPKAINSFTYGNMLSNNLNVNIPMSSANTSVTGKGSSDLHGATKLNNAFSPSVSSSLLPTSSTSSGPTFTNMSSAKLSSTNIATTTSAPTFSTAVTTASFSNLANTPSFTFNSRSKPITNDMTPSTFNSNALKTTASTTTFANNNNFATDKTEPSISGFSFNFDSKTQNQPLSGQNSQELAKQAGSNAFNSNTSSLFSFGTKTAAEPANIFGNVINSTESNIFNSSSTTSIFGSNSAKATTQTSESTIKNKSEVLAAPAAFGGNNSSNSTSPFIFGSKSAINSSNTSTAPGGFSFSSAITNSADVGSFGFGGKSNGQPNALNNIFSGTSSSDSQNKSWAFSATSNKSDNSQSIFAANKQAANTTSGFSFGTTTSIKTPTFTFGGANTTAESAIKASNVSNTGFTFGSSTATKQIESPANKQLSFGSSQAVQQKQVSTNNANSIFGLSGANKAAQPSFNFNAGNSPSLQSNALTSNNIFTPSANITTGPGDRLIRRATRRLQK